MHAVLQSPLPRASCVERLRAELLPDDPDRIRSGRGRVFGTVTEDSFAIRRVQVWLGFRRWFPWTYGLGLRGDLRSTADGTEIRLGGWGDRYFRAWTSAALVLGPLVGLVGLWLIPAVAASSAGNGWRLTIGLVLGIAGSYFLVEYPRAILRTRHHQRQTVVALRDWVAGVCDARVVESRD